jgi:hypothetical protein
LIYFISSIAQKQDPNIVFELHFYPFLSEVPMPQKFTFSKVKTLMV